VNISATVAYASPDQPQTYEVYRSPSGHREAVRASVLADWADGGLDPRSDDEGVQAEFTRQGADGNHQLIRKTVSEPLLDTDPVEVNSDLPTIVEGLSPLQRNVLYLVEADNLRVLVPLWMGEEPLSVVSRTTDLRLYEEPSPDSPMEFERWKASRIPAEIVSAGDYDGLTPPVPQVLRENHLEILRVVNQLSAFDGQQAELPTGVVDTNPYLIEVDVHEPVASIPDGEWMFVELNVDEPGVVAARTADLQQLADAVRYYAVNGSSAALTEYVIEKNWWGTVIPSVEDYL